MKVVKMNGRVTPGTQVEEQQIRESEWRKGYETLMSERPIIVKGGGCGSHKQVPKLIDFMSRKKTEEE